MLIGTEIWLLLDPLSRQRNEIDVCILTLVYTNIYNLISIYKYLPISLPTYLPTFVVMFLILIQHPRHLWVYSSLHHYFCLFILFMGFSKQEYWSGLPFPSPVDHILSDLSIMTRLSWVAPQAWLSFIELDKVVVLVWLHWLVFCEYGFSVSALWCLLETPTVLLGFLLPSMWGISLRLLQQSAAVAPYLELGVAPPARHPNLRRGVAPLGHSCAIAAWHSRPLPLTSDVGCA